jgi:hypothetical protein
MFILFYNVKKHSTRKNRKATCFIWKRGDSVLPKILLTCFGAGSVGEEGGTVFEVDGVAAL